jgi:hypothetical protein
MLTRRDWLRLAVIWTTWAGCLLAERWVQWLRAA